MGAHMPRSGHDYARLPLLRSSMRAPAPSPRQRGALWRRRPSQPSPTWGPFSSLATLPPPPPRPLRCRRRLLLPLPRCSRRGGPCARGQAASAPFPQPGPRPRVGVQLPGLPCHPPHRRRPLSRARPAGQTRPRRRTGLAGGSTSGGATTTATRTTTTTRERMTRMRATALLGLSLALSPPSRRPHSTCRLALSHRRPRRPRRPRRRLSPSSSPPLGCRQRCSMPADHHHLLLVVQHPPPTPPPPLACRRLGVGGPRRHAHVTTTMTGAAGGGAAARHITARGGGAVAVRGGAAATRPFTTATGLRAGAPRPLLLHGARRARLTEATQAGPPRLGALSRMRGIGSVAGAGLAAPRHHRRRLEMRCCQAATGPRRMAAARDGASEAAAWSGSGGGKGTAAGRKHLPVKGRWGALPVTGCGGSPGGAALKAVSEAGGTT